jgi:peptidoglycan/xylan/chitin deacetylase (PgdA/CDA1 family)
MRLVSPLLKRVVYPCLSKAGYLQRTPEAPPVVVTYHGVLPNGYKVIDRKLDGNLVSSDVLRRQLGFLQSRYNIIAPEEFRLWCEQGRELPAHSVLLTCDDGLVNSVIEMLPILQEFRASCLFFITGASVDDTITMLWYEELYLMLLQSENTVALHIPEISLNTRATGWRQKRALWWQLVKHLSQFDRVRRRALLNEVRVQLALSERWNSTRSSEALRRRFSLLTPAELSQLLDAGMTVGAHSLSHPILSRLPAELAWKEIRDSRYSLEATLGKRVWAFAYPFGDPFSVGPREFEMARRAGFTCAFLNVDNSKNAAMNYLALPRVHVTGNMSLPEFEAHISGLHSSLRKLFSSTNTITDRMGHLAPSSA